MFYDVVQSFGHRNGNGMLQINPYGLIGQCVVQLRHQITHPERCGDARELVSHGHCMQRASPNWLIHVLLRPRAHRVVHRVKKCENGVHSC